MHDPAFDHDEHAPEPIPGLPTHLPEGETILWQGSPETGPFLRRVLYLRAIVLYLGIVLVASATIDLASGVALPTALGNALSWLVVGSLPLGLLWIVGRHMARSTIYTITSARVVMRFGVALPITINLPFTQLAAADVRPFDDGTGDLSLTLTDLEGTNYAILWPHVRPWRFLQASPALRCIADATQVAERLATAWSTATGESERSVRPAAPVAAAPAGPLSPAHR